MLPISELKDFIGDNSMAGEVETVGDGSTKKQLRILVTATHEGEGCAHIDKYLPAIVKTGHSIAFVGWDREKKMPKVRTEGKVVYKLIFRGWNYGGKNLLFALPLWSIRLFFHLLFQKPDMIFAIDLDCAFSACLANCFRLRRIPIIYDIRDTYAIRPTVPWCLRKPVQMVDNWVMKRVEKIIVPDETRILDDFKFKDKFTVIYNCCRDVSDSVSPERKDRSGKPFSILATGYLMKYRGIELLLQAARHLPEMRILMAGHIIESDVQKMVDAHRQVQFLGRVPLLDA